MRFAAVAVVAVGVLALAGCTSGSDGGDAATSGSGVTVSDSQPTGASSSTTTGPTTTSSSTLTTTPTTSSSLPSTRSTPVATASVAQPADPVVAAGNAAAWSLTRAAPGAPQTRQLATVTCGQDGSVVGDGLQLAAGAARLTLTDPTVTVTGTAELDAAGGTFRGRNADTAVSFTWTC